MQGAKRKIGYDVILRMPDDAGLYSLSEGDKTGETDTGQRQSQTIINRFSEPVVIHEVECNDFGKLCYKYLYVANRVYQLHPELHTVLVCMTDNTGTTYVIETVRNSQGSKYPFKAESFDCVCLVSGPALMCPRLNESEAERFIQLVSSYLLKTYTAAGTGKSNGAHRGSKPNDESMQVSSQDK